MDLIRLAEGCRPLGEEGGDAFARIIGTEDAITGLQRFGDRFRIGPIEGKVDDGLGHLYRQARPTSEHSRQVASVRECLTCGDDPIDEAPGKGLLDIDRLGEKDHLLGPGLADLSGYPERPATAWGIRPA